MNFSLDYIELYIDDAYIEIGERLLEKGAMKHLFLAEKNLWLATVTDGKDYEVEIRLVQNQIKATTCDCAGYSEQKVCNHIAATLLQLRRLQQEANTSNTKQTVLKKRKSVPKITINTILNNVEHQALLHFIKAYARKNRSFSVALKTRFAAHVDVENAQDKYLQVLGAAINIHKSPKGGYNTKGIRQILKTGNQLIAQAEDVIALKNYPEGFSILSASLLKISPLLRYNPQKEENRNYIMRLLQTFYGLYEMEIAPDLRQKMWHFVRHEAFKTFYFQEEIEDLFFNLLLEITTDQDKVQKLTDSALLTISKPDLTTANKVHLIAFQLALYEKDNASEKAEALIEAHIEKEEVLIMAIEDALRKDKIDRAKQLALNKKDSIKNRFLRQKIDGFLLDIALKESDKASIVTYAEQRFLQTYRMEYYDLLKQYHPDTTAMYQSLVAQIQKHPYSTQKRDTIAQLHYRQNNISALLDYFEAIRSLDLLQSFDQLLLQEHKQRLYQIYEDLLIEYIRSHLGRKSSEKTGAIIRHLHDIGAHDLSKKLVQIFRQDYSERHTLMEELQFF